MLTFRLLNHQKKRKRKKKGNTCASLYPWFLLILKENEFWKISIRPYSFDTFKTPATENPIHQHKNGPEQPLGHEKVIGLHTYCGYTTAGVTYTQTHISLSVKISLERHVDSYCLFGKSQQIDSLGVNQRWGLMTQIINAVTVTFLTAAHLFWFIQSFWEL